MLHSTIAFGQVTSLVSMDGNKKPQLRPLILVERARGLRSRTHSSKCRDVQDSSPTGVVSRHARVIQHSPSWVSVDGAPGSFLQPSRFQGLPTPPQTPILTDSHERKRGKSAPTLQYHLPFRAIKRSLSPCGPLPRLSAPPPPDSGDSVSRINVKWKNPDNATSHRNVVDSPPDLSALPPRPMSRMSWCSRTTASTDITMIGAPKRSTSILSGRHHRRSQSYGNMRTLSCASRGSSGTFGGGWLGSHSSYRSAFDQENVVEVSEGHLEETPGPIEGQPSKKSDAANSTPTQARSKPLTILESLSLRPRIHLAPELRPTFNRSETESGTGQGQMSSIPFPSVLPNPETPVDISSVTVSDSCQRAILPRRTRVFSLPTCMPSAESFHPSDSTLHDAIHTPPEMESARYSSATPTQSGHMHTRPRRLLRKPRPLSDFPIFHSPSQTPTSSGKPASPVIRETVKPPIEINQRKLADTSTCTTSQGTETSKRPKARNKAIRLLYRVLNDWKTTRMDSI